MEQRTPEPDLRLFRSGDVLPSSWRATGALPPGQREISSFPRYGAHFGRPDPPVPERPQIEVTGPEIAPRTLDAPALQNLPRAALVADFHCVAGWTARGLYWEGVRLRDIYETLVPRDPAALKAITHIRAVGRDGWRAVLLLEDALSDDVLVADRLDRGPLSPEHGGPFRLVSAGQYGYKSVKHLSRIELHAGEPSDAPTHLIARLALKAFAPHPRARVGYEERSRVLPNWSLRWISAVVHPPSYILGYLGAMLDRRRPRPPSG